MLRALAAAILVFSLTGCQNLPPPLPLPEQFVPFETFRPYRISRTVSMGDEAAATHFVSGILPLVGTWAWTNKRPTVKLTTAGTENVLYVIDFSIADVTFKDTGPVTVTFFVNDHALGTQLYDKPGAKHWEKLVPGEWLQPKSETLVAAEIDKVWKSPDDGAQLGFILSNIGLVESRPGQ
jgi:hypothetical protein